MKRLLLTLNICLTFCATQGQEPTIIERLHGKTVKDNLFFRNNGVASIQYKIDDDSIWRDVKKGAVFAVKNGDEHSIGLYVRFYNPLQYSLSSGLKEAGDPAYLSLLQFLQSALPALKDLSAFEAAAQPLSPLPKNLSTLDANLLLYQWTFDLVNQVDFAAIRADSTLEKQKMYNALVDQINGTVKPLDDYLFRRAITINHGVDAGKSNGFNEWLLMQKEALVNCPSDYIAFLQALADAENLWDDLAIAQKMAEKGLERLKQLMTVHFDARILPLLHVTGAESFKKYSAAASVQLFTNSVSLMGGQRQRLVDFSKLLKMLTLFTSDFDSEFKGYRLDCRADFEAIPTKMLSFAFSVSALDKVGSQRSSKYYQFDCTVARHHAIVPFVSSGVFYTDIVYPGYALRQINGEFTVAETKGTRIRVRPAVFLNLLFSVKRNWLYPFLQLGVAMGADDYLLPFGAGIVLGNSLSISGGSVMGRRKNLRTLQVGGPVTDEAALKGDLGSKGFLSGYFSLSYNFFRR